MLFRSNISSVRNNYLSKRTSLDKEVCKKTLLSRFKNDVCEDADGDFFLNVEDPFGLPKGTYTVRLFGYSDTFFCHILYLENCNGTKESIQTGFAETPLKALTTALRKI